SVNGAGNELTANGVGGVVFKLTLNADGSWSFDLQDQLDHFDDAANGENYELLLAGGGSVAGIDFSSMIVVEDNDGDKLVGLAPGSFTVRVQDDVPTLGTSAPNLGPNLIQNGSFEIGHGLGSGGWNNFHSIPGWTSNDNGTPGDTTDDVPFELQYN